MSVIPEQPAGGDVDTSPSCIRRATSPDNRRPSDDIGNARHCQRAAAHDRSIINALPYTAAGTSAGYCALPSRISTLSKNYAA